MYNNFRGDKSDLKLYKTIVYYYDYYTLHSIRLEVNICSFQIENITTFKRLVFVIAIDKEAPKSLYYLKNVKKKYFSSRTEIRCIYNGVWLNKFKNKVIENNIVFDETLQYSESNFLVKCQELSKV